MDDDDGCPETREQTGHDGALPVVRAVEQGGAVITQHALVQAVSDLRVSLQSIVDAIDSLQRGRGFRDPAQMHAGLVAIERAAAEMNHAVDDLTDTELIRTGALVLRRGSARLDDLIEQALEHLPSLAAQKRIQFFFFASGEGAALSCDEERIFRLLVTLLGNAVGFTPAGGEIVIRCWSSGAEVGVEIRDSGPSIAERYRLCVVDRLRSGSTSARLGKSPGLGLNIARAVAAAHGGRLWVSHDAGRGATFALALPRGLAH